MGATMAFERWAMRPAGATERSRGVGARVRRALAFAVWLGSLAAAMRLAAFLGTMFWPSDRLIDETVAAFEKQPWFFAGLPIAFSAALLVVLAIQRDHEAFLARLDAETLARLRSSSSSTTSTEESS